MKRYIATIPIDIRPTRLFPLVRRMLPELPDHVIREAFEKRDVKMNGARVGKDEAACPGAVLQLYTRHEAETKPPEILFEDTNLLIIRKRAGISCEADAKGGKTVTEWVGEALRKQEPTATDPLLCHRLDNQTDGLLLLAKQERTQAALEAVFQNRQVHKVYACLVKGTPVERHGWLKAYLTKDAEQSRVRVSSHPGPGAREILTEYEVMEPGAVSRLRVTLHTGRTHQIRAHLASIGHPLLGDDTYGDRAFNKAQKAKRLMLCATELWFSADGELSYMKGKHFSILPTF